MPPCCAPGFPEGELIMGRKRIAKSAPVDYAELCDVLRIKINAARKPATGKGPKVGKYMSESQLDVAASGSQIGDPREGAARRLADVDGAFARGTVKVPRKGESGRTKLTEVEATAEHVREALDYWKGRKPRTDASRSKQSAMVSELTRRYAAMTSGPSVMTADVSPEGFTQHMLPGPAIVQGPNMAPERKTWRNPETGLLEPAAARLDGSLTERLDRTVADPRPRARFTPSQRKNWRRKQQRAELAAAKAKIADLESELKHARGLA